MVLKDWKRTKYGDWHGGNIMSMYGNNNLLYIKQFKHYKTKKNTFGVFLETNKKGYLFRGTVGSGIPLKTFKTKSQAPKYAKAYMRKH